jgi:hypothetical protein
MLAYALLMVFAARAICADTQVVPAPTQAELADWMREAFGQQPGQEGAALITRSQAAKFLVTLEHAGWKVAEPDALLERVLADDDLLVQQLSDAKGRAFMAKLSRVNGGIDRLDRLARMPQGAANVRDLIHKVPNGSEWIDAMVNSPHGRRMAKTMTNSRAGRTFNQPTGRIYTAKDLLAYLDGKLIPVF